MADQYTTPLFSIIIPVYQNGKNLPHLLKEINDFIPQVPEYNFELVFIDDGSTDNSYNEMQKIAEKHKLPLIYDAAASMGLKYNNRTIIII